MKIKFFVFKILLLFFIINSCTNTSPKNNFIKNEILIEDTSSQKKIKEILQPKDIEKKYLIGKYNPETDSNFLQIPSKYCTYRIEYIHREVYFALLQMLEYAYSQGINLKIVSAVRNYDTQLYLWNSQISARYDIKTIKNALKYIAMPGTSRHHWGTDIDFNSTTLQFYKSSEGIAIYEWLCENAPKFGFYQVYTSNRKTGYFEEKWHWSYKNLAIEFQENYKIKISYSDLGTFRGSEFCKELDIFNNFVFGIDSVFL